MESHNKQEQILQNKIIKSSHSNDHVSIVKKNNKLLIKKIFTQNLSRSLKNINKQILFNSLKLSSSQTHAIEVISLKNNQKNIEILMPYIFGLNGAEIISELSYDLGKFLSKSLDSYIHDIFEKSEINEISISVFKKKFFEIKKKNKDVRLINFFNCITNELSLFPEFIEFPVGYCHGDLTLSNLIITKENKIYLFDFLDIYFESPLQDIVKLKQDFVHGWSFRYENKAMQNRAKIFSIHNTPKLINYYSKKYSNQIYLLELLSLSRIVPYIRDDLTVLWLINSLNNIIKKKR